MRTATYSLSLLACFAFLAASVNAQKQGQSYIDSLLTRLPSANTDTTKADLLRKISFCYSTVDPDKGIRYGMEGLSLSQQLGWTKGKGINCNSIATNYINKGEYSLALDYLRQAYRNNREAANQRGMGHNLRNIGLIYEKQADYFAAMDTEMKALDAYKSIHDSDGMAAMYCNIGTVFADIDEYPLARRAYMHALRDSRVLGNKRDEAINLNNLGYVSMQLNQLEEALSFLAESSNINESLNDNIGRIQVMFNQGRIFQKQLHYQKAMEMYTKGLSLARKLDDKQMIAQYTARIGNCYLDFAKDKEALKHPAAPFKASKTANLAEAITLLDSALTRCRSLGDQDEWMIVSQWASEANAEAGNYQRAYDLLRDYTRLRSQLDASIRRIYAANYLAGLDRD